MHSSSFEEKRSTIGDTIYSFTFLAVGSIIQNVTSNPSITAMGAIIAPAKAADHIPSIAPGKTAVAAAARPTPIAALAGVIILPKTKLSLSSFSIESFL